MIDNVRVRSVGRKQTITPKEIEQMQEGEALQEPLELTPVYFDLGGQA